MALILFRPELARRSCQECAAWLYDEKTGERLSRRGKPVPRPSTSPTPCAQCPKGSPSREHETRLTPRNAAVVELYRIVRATNGAAMSEEMRQDRRMLEDLAVCDDLFRERDQQESRKAMSENVARGVADSLGKAMGG